MTDTIQPTPPPVATENLTKSELRPRSIIYPLLTEVTTPTVTTAAAAYYLNRRPQTLRIYSSQDTGPVRPIRISGRLAWPVAELRRVLGV